MTEAERAEREERARITEMVDAEAKEQNRDLSTLLKNNYAAHHGTSDSSDDNDDNDDNNFDD